MPYWIYDGRESVEMSWTERLRQLPQIPTLGEIEKLLRELPKGMRFLQDVPPICHDIRHPDEMIGK